MILDNYDDFNFMVILLFLFFMLMGFIIIIMINLKSKKFNKIPTQYSISSQYPQSTKYPNITAQKCIPNTTEGQC